MTHRMVSFKNWDDLKDQSKFRKRDIGSAASVTAAAAAAACLHAFFSVESLN